MSIGTAASGTIKAVLVHEGSRVRAGDILVSLNCEPLEAEAQSRDAQLRAAQAVLDRVVHGPRAEEIAVAEAVVGYANARAEEAEKTYQRTQALREGVSVTTARILETLRDARVYAAQLGEAKAKLALLRAGSREEDVREAYARRDDAAAQAAVARARLDQCAVRAPADGIITDVFANPGEFVSLAVPATLVNLLPDAAIQVRAEIDARDIGRACEGQAATITAEAAAGATLQGRVASVSPMLVARTMFVSGTDTRSNDVARIILAIEGGGTTLPIGAPVNVTLAPCARRPPAK